MKKHLSLLPMILAVMFVIAAHFDLAAAQEPAGTQAPPTVDRRKIPLAQRPNLTLEDVNTYVGVDRRIIVMMAALNIAGYDYEPASRPLSALRLQLREDLKATNPEIVRKLRNHFQAHRGSKTDAAAVAPYLSLALSLTDPPAFTLDVAAERLPEDVREITDFALLLEEFYRETRFSRLLPKYTEIFTKAALTYGEPAGNALGSVLTYLHTVPVLELPPLFVPRRTAPPPKQEKKNSKNDKNAQNPAAQETPFEVPNRVRQFVILPDLFNSSGSANLRVVRDVYFLLLGPTTEPNIEAMRRAFLSFVIDPLTEKQIREVAGVRNDLKALMESRGERLDQEYAQQSAYYLITDSIVRATDARMDVLGVAARRTSPEDEAIYQLSLAYDRGAVLVYHFYDQMKAFEPVGVDIRDYYSSILKNIDFERESQRLKEYEQRLARYRQIRTEATLAPTPPPTISNADEKLVAMIVEADQMMKTRRYAEARTVLESALKERPNNARVLFGLAEVTSKQASTLDDPDRVEEALYAAVEFYRQSARNSSPESELWLAQRSYVAAAKILDFIAENNPAVAEQASADATAAYELALKIGKVDGGAYEEAEKALKSRKN
ncbi:MAG: hypothetical protein AB7H86_19020 [Blastocatellales bacterium]